MSNASWETDSCSGKQIKVIPYHPSQIKVEKRVAKKSPVVFCATRKIKNTSKSDHVPSSKSQGSSDLQSTPALSADELDMSDMISVVSDISELSVSTLDDVMRQANTPRSTLAAVHGRKHTEGKNYAQPPRKNDILVEPSATITRMAKKHDLQRLKEENFRLRRENANVKSQLEAIMTQREADALTKGSNEDSQSVEFRNHLRKAHEDIVRLQTAESRLQSLLKDYANEILRLKQEQSSVVAENKSLTERNNALQNQITIARQDDGSHEHQVNFLRREVATLTQSQSWYETQLKLTQEARRALENSLAEAKLELSSKNERYLELQRRTEETEYALDKERRSFENEKLELEEKVREVESDLLDRETERNLIDKEKDNAVKELSLRLKQYEADNDLAKNMSTTIHEMATSLESLKRHQEEKELENERLREESKNVADENVILSGQVLQLTSTANDKQHENELLINEEQVLRRTIEAMEQKHEGEVSDLKQQIVSLRQAANEAEGHVNEQKLLMQSLSREAQELEIKLVNEMEATSDAKGRQHELEKASQAKDARIQELEQEVQSVQAQILQSSTAREQLSKELQETQSREAKLQEDVNILAMQMHEVRRTPDQDIQVIREENISLRQRIQFLEQFENEAADLRQENAELAEAKVILNGKLLEAEKVYDEEVEKLRSLVEQRDEMIASMRSDLEMVETDLGRTKDLLETTSSDNAKILSEQSKKLDDLEEAMETLDETKRRLAEREAALAESQDKLVAAQDDNEGLTKQLQNVLSRADMLESENRRLQQLADEDRDASEEIRIVQQQRIARLESFVSEYEKEVEVLMASRAQLESQIIALEATNGKLQTESVINASLREQVTQLQKDLRDDTCLREELVRNIESAKSGLSGEIAALEVALANEKERAVKAAKEKSMLQRELNLVCARIESDRSEGRGEGCRAADDDSTIRELKQIAEERNRRVISLEDRVATLQFQMQQKDTELSEVRNLAKMNVESLEAKLERMKENEASLKAEVESRKRSLEALTEDRNNYRGQVQQMNLALRNSLDHIKQLRSQATSHPPSPSHSGDPNRALPLSPNWSPSSSSTGRNLSNLQACLASLRAEVSILQSRLAPSSSSMPSPS